MSALETSKKIGMSGATISMTEVETAREVAFKKSGKHYLVGILKCPAETGDDDGQSYVVGNAWSNQNGPVGNIRVTYYPSNNRPLFKFKWQDFVVVSGGTKPYFMSTDYGPYPIQLVKWSSFEESDSEHSAIAYFRSNARGGELRTKCNYIIGNEVSIGHVIIEDDAEDGQKLYLQGFSYSGSRKVKFSEVKSFAGDFQKQIIALNHEVKVDDYDGSSVYLLIPKKKGPNKVLECEGWESLLPVMKQDVQVARKKKQDRREEMEAAQNAANNDKLNERLERARSASGLVVDKPMPGQALSPTQATQAIMPMIPEPEATERTSVAATANSKTDRDISEIEFLENFKTYVARCGFEYDDRDLVRFHTCVKTGMMTLVGGDPGCGKSSLFELYARVLAGNKYNADKPDFKQIDVNPAWVEPADLLGYSAPCVSGKDGEDVFHEAQCDLRRFLLDLHGAGARPPALVCFEEMNLARIELYFSDFVQLISRYQLESDKKKLQAYGGKNGKTALALPSDLRFVGTCNEDSTVKPMSDRFLDRVNLIRLCGALHSKLNNVDDRGDKYIPLFSNKKGRVQNPETDPVSAENYVSWIRKLEQDDQNGIGKKLDGIFGDFANALKDIDVKPSPRVCGEILRYVENRPSFESNMTEKRRVCTAFDEAIVQRMISKCVPNVLLKGKFKKAAQELEKGFKKFLEPQGNDESSESEVSKGDDFMSLAAQRLIDLEKQTERLFTWVGEGAGGELQV